MTEKYIGFVEADAGITVYAESEEEAMEKLKEATHTGHLGPYVIAERDYSVSNRPLDDCVTPKVRGVELFDN